MTDYEAYEIEWETGQVITAMIYTRREWNSPPLSDTPFHEEVVREAVRL